MRKNIRNSISLYIVVFIILLFSSCRDNKCITFHKQNGAVSYSVEKGSGVMIIHENWRDSRSDKELLLSAKTQRLITPLSAMPTNRYCGFFF